MALLVRFSLVLAAILCMHAVSAQTPPIRSTAVVDLSFDEADGPAEDRATAGVTKDTAQPKNGIERVASPFWNATAGRAILTDAGSKRYFEVADSADLDHAEGTTLSFYFLNLHPKDDKVFHGIVAKRAPNNQGSKTNYGLNFQPSSGNLQVYIHAGAGFKVVRFPLEAAFGVRRLVHLTATFRPGTAPGSATDAAADDLEIRLFVNGKPLKPSESPGSQVTEDAGWIPDVDFAALPNDAPLTIGGSFPGNELTNGLIDELLVFNRPLTVDEVARLFEEVAGPSGAELAQRELEVVTATGPTVADVDPPGLQIGQTSRLVITGERLGPQPVVSMTGVDATFEVAAESTAERLVVDVTVPADTVPNLGLLSVRTNEGISEARPVPVDRLNQQAMPSGTTDVVNLPAAFFGTLNGPDRPAIVVEGTRGQTFVAEVELKRLGGTADAVLELKTPAGVPIDIAWGRSIRGGDPRLIASLPYDGKYVLELHDLAYQAAASRFRLIAGELTMIDSVLPTSLERGTNRTAVPIGVGLSEATVSVSSVSGRPTALLAGPAVEASPVILPVVPLRSHPVVNETETATAPIAFTTAGVTLSGMLGEKGEVDVFRLTAEPGKEVELVVEARSLGSPVEPVVWVTQQDREIGRNAARPGQGRVRFKVTPTEDGHFEIHVGDRLGPQKSIARFYEVQVTPAGHADFQVTLLDSAIRLPRSGRGIARFRIARQGQVGDIRLMADPASGLIFEPDVFPAGRNQPEFYVAVRVADGAVPASTVALSVEAEIAGEVATRPVRVTPSRQVTTFDAARPVFEVPVATIAAVPAIDTASDSLTVFRGTTTTIDLSLAGESLATSAIRFSLMTDERPRPVDPAKPAAEKKPLVRLSDDAVVSAGEETARLTLIVPADVEVDAIRGVIKGEVVPHAWSMQSINVGYSAPLKMTVKDAIVSAQAASSILKPGENSLNVTIARQAGYESPVRVELRGLPEGWNTAPVDVAADASEALLPVTIPADAAAGDVPNVELVVLGLDGVVLKSVKPFALSVQP